MSGLRELLGNDSLKEYYEKAVREQSVSHAYILSGEPGSGRKTAAQAVAAALLCTGEGERPCGQCRACRMIRERSHPDLRFLTHEKPGTVSVDEVREQVIADAPIRPYYGPYKIYILDEAEKMNPQAQNALLKTIEEPPSYVILFLITASADALLPTIRSRCIHLKTQPLPDETILSRLREKGVGESDAAVIAAFARGNLGKALDLASSERFGDLRRMILSLLKNDRRSVAEIQEMLKNLKDGGYDPGQALDLLTLWFRDVLMYKATREVGLLVFRDEFSYIRRRADRSSFEGLEEILRAVDRARTRLAANVNFELTMELLLLTIKEF